MKNNEALASIDNTVELQDSYLRILLRGKKWREVWEIWHLPRISRKVRNKHLWGIFSASCPLFLATSFQPLAILWPRNYCYQHFSFVEIETWRHHTRMETCIQNTMALLLPAQQLLLSSSFTGYFTSKHQKALGLVPDCFSLSLSGAQSASIVYCLTHAEDSKLYISNLALSPLSVFSWLPDISTWMSNRHLNLFHVQN